MRALPVLLRKELHAIFTSPMAYATGAVFLLVLGYTFSLSVFFTRAATLGSVFNQIALLLAVLVPLLTMRAFAEERRSDTLELLLTAPVGETAVVLAKFLAVLGLVVTLLVASGIYAVVLAVYGTPDWGPVYGGYLALVLFAGLLVAIGILMSALTDNQVVAAAASLGTFLVLWFADAATYVLPAPFDRVAVNLAMAGHFTAFVGGSLFLSDAGYYLTLSLLALFLATRRLADR